MKYTNRLLCIGTALLLGATSCRKEEDQGPEKLNTLPEFYLPAIEGEYGLQKPEIKVAATSSDFLNKPQDLDFHPTRQNELWVINKDIEQTGGSTLTISNAGSGNQSIEFRRDGNAWHFMALPSAMAFSENGNFSTTADILDANRQGGTFTGPSLWSSDMNIYAKPSGGNGSHLDMLHGSPFCMGIASEKDNVFWVFDGYHGHLVRYDFQDDHGPGNDFHGDAKVHRFTEVKLKRNGDIPCHMVLDAAKKWLYIIDGGNQRILRVNIKTGTKKGELQLINEQLEEHWQMTGMETEVLSINGVINPTGIDIRDNRLFISDYDNGNIIAWNVDTKEEMGRIKTGAKGISGIKISPDGKLWYVNALNNELSFIQPK